MGVRGIQATVRLKKVGIRSVTRLRAIAIALSLASIISTATPAHAGSVWDPNEPGHRLDIRWAGVTIQADGRMRVTITFLLPPPQESMVHSCPYSRMASSIRLRDTRGVHTRPRYRPLSFRTLLPRPAPRTIGAALRWWLQLRFLGPSGSAEPHHHPGPVPAQPRLTRFGLVLPRVDHGQVGRTDLRHHGLGKNLRDRGRTHLSFRAPAGGSSLPPPYRGCMANPAMRQLAENLGPQGGAISCWSSSHLPTSGPT